MLAVIPMSKSCEATLHEAATAECFLPSHYLFSGVCDVLRAPTSVLVAMARCMTVWGLLVLAAGWLEVFFPQIGRNKPSVCDTLPKSVSLGTYMICKIHSCLHQYDGLIKFTKESITKIDTDGDRCMGNPSQYFVLLTEYSTHCSQKKFPAFMEPSDLLP